MAGSKTHKIVLVVTITETWDKAGGTSGLSYVASVLDQRTRYQRAFDCGPASTVGLCLEGLTDAVQSGRTFHER